MKQIKYSKLLIIGVVLLIAGCSSVAESKETEKIEVALKEYSIGTGEIRLMTSDIPSKITIKNKGMSAHNFVIQDLGIDSGVLKPGESVTLEINAKDSKVLQAKCTLPGHTEAGMVSKVTINK